MQLFKRSRTLTMAALAVATSALPALAVPAIYYDGSTFTGYVRIDNTLTWDAARLQALTTTFRGVSGQLASIRSANENSAVVASINGATSWIGANDIANNNSWVWSDAPGTTFFNQTVGGSGGAAVGGAFANWNGGEPNGANVAPPGGENVATILSNGLWNDLPVTSTVGSYVAEYNNVTLGGNVLAANGHAYDVIRSGAKTWDQANAEIATLPTPAGFLKGHMVSIQTSAENSFVAGLGNGQESWIGANDITTNNAWAWTNNPNNAFFNQTVGGAGGTTVGGAFTSWNGGEPNGANVAPPAGESVAVIQSGGGWNDLSVTATRDQYAVEWTPFSINPTNGNAYAVIEVNATWQQAQVLAAGIEAPYGFQPGKLVVISSAAENAFVHALVAGSGSGDAWIGASDQLIEGSWIWVDGTAFWTGAAGGTTVGGAFANWATGEPNDSSNEDFASMRVLNGQWNDLGANAFLTRFVVEFQVVPEPGSLSLMGLGAIALMRRRRVA